MLDEIARLYAAAHVGDIDSVTREYGSIVEQYKSPPNVQLSAWQAVLDAQDPPVPPNLLWFVRNN